jgi:hypothetical protein
MKEGGGTMRPRKIIFLLLVFILAITSPVLAARGGGPGGAYSGGPSGGHGGAYRGSPGGPGGGHGGAYSGGPGGAYRGGPSGGHGGAYRGGPGHSGGYYGRGYYGGGVHFYPRAYWGPGLYYGYWGWPFYYPPDYYYYPPPNYYSTPPTVYSTPPSGDVTEPQATGGQVFIYPRNGQSQEQLINDRKECETWAMNQAGVDLTNPPPSGMTEAQKAQKSQDYYRALGACLDGRGYTAR